MTEASEQVRPGLPIGWTARATFGSLWHNGPALARAIILPATLLLAGNLSSAWLESRAPFAGVLARLVGLLAFPIFAVRWHRLLLRGEAIASPIPTLDRSIAVYGAWAGGFYLATSAYDHTYAHALAALAPESSVFGRFVAYQTGFVALSIVLLRLSLALPAAALGESTALRRIWGLGRGNTVALCVATLAVALLSALPFAPFVAMDVDAVEHVRRLWDSPSVSTRLLGYALVMSTWCLATAIEVGLTSHCYGFLATGSRVSPGRARDADS